MNSVKSSDGMKTDRACIIAIDGYSSCGKSTFARLIARELNYVYIDSGAMYRSVSLYFLQNGLLVNGNPDPSGLRQALDKIHIHFALNSSNGMQETYLNGRNVEEEIRGIEVSAVVSKISQIKEVREKMVGLQRNIGKKGGVVMDGRDIGTVVFPDAGLKIFMTADTEVRARRRYKELVEKGLKVDLDEIMANIRMRDHEDENRLESPLRKATDAIILDNSSMTIEQQMNWFSEIWKNITHRHEH
jgi:cytidylate kinase